MTEAGQREGGRPSFDLVAIGNAVIDILAGVDEAAIAAAGIARGSMRFLDAPSALRLQGNLIDAQEVSGGSAANTAVGLAALGGRAAFVGRTGADRLGGLFAQELARWSVHFAPPAAAPREGASPTGRCFCLVTPDGQRTMAILTGAAHELSPGDVDPRLIADAAILYLEGYLWESAAPRAAMERAIAIARQAGRQVALTLSDPACVTRERGRFAALLASGAVDLLFCNEAELAALRPGEDREETLRGLNDQVPLIVVTLGPDGALAATRGAQVHVPAAPARVVDTTGAGDLFAAGFLFGHARGEPIDQCLRYGARVAAEIVSHFGARPARDLGTLIAS